MFPTPSCGLHQEDWTSSEFFLDTCNFALIPIIKTFLYFKVWPNKVCAIVWVDNSWFMSFCDKTSKTHDEGIGRQGVHDSQRYSCSQKAGEMQPYFFRSRAAFFLRGSKKSTPSLENGGPACRWSAVWPAIKGSSGFSLFKHNILTKFALRVTKKLTSKYK